MNIIPLHSNLLIEKEYITQIGSILLPDEVVPESQVGVVKAIGPRVKGVSVGDRVTFPKYVGVNFTIRDSKYYMLEENYILGIEEPQA